MSRKPDENGYGPVWNTITRRTPTTCQFLISLTYRNATMAMWMAGLLAGRFENERGFWRGPNGVRSL